MWKIYTKDNESRLQLCVKQILRVNGKEVKLYDEANRMTDEEHPYILNIHCAVLPTDWRLVFFMLSWRTKL